MSWIRNTAFLALALGKLIPTLIVVIRCVLLKFPFFRDAFLSGGQEKLVYIPCIVPDKSRPDYLVTVDVDSKSNTYSQVMGELHCIEVLRIPIRIRIRIHRIHMLLGLPDPNLDPLVRGIDPDPSIIMQK
jgi:hypothetical protein